MGDCLGHLPYPDLKWLAESEWMLGCRSCKKIRGTTRDSWFPILRSDSEDIFTVKWTKERKPRNRSLPRCRSDICFHGKTPMILRGESGDDGGTVTLKKSYSSCPGICTTNRAESKDLCKRCVGDSWRQEFEEGDPLLPSSTIQFCNCNYCSMEDEESDMMDIALENDQPRDMKQSILSQKMSSSLPSTLLAAGDGNWFGDCDCGGEKKGTTTGNDSAILVLESQLKVVDKI